MGQWGDRGKKGKWIKGIKELENKHTPSVREDTGKETSMHAADWALRKGGRPGPLRARRGPSGPPGTLALPVGQGWEVGLVQCPFTWSVTTGIALAKTRMRLEIEECVREKERWRGQWDENNAAAKERDSKRKHSSNSSFNHPKIILIWKGRWKGKGKW